MKNRTQPTDTVPKNSETVNRRKLLKALAASGTATVTAHTLPTEWRKPLIEFVLLPAHAQVTPSSPPPPNQILQFLYDVNAAAAGTMGAEVMCIANMLGGELQNARALVSSDVPDGTTIRLDISFQDGNAMLGMMNSTVIGTVSGGIATFGGNPMGIGSDLNICGDMFGMMAMSTFDTALLAFQFDPPLSGGNTLQANITLEE